jgi:hypothetical protein
VNAPMTAEEFRLNKQLLKEISRKKKEKMMSELSQNDILQRNLGD